MRARLVQFFDLRPGEALPVALTFAYIALVVASFLLAKPVRNALFLQQYGAYNLTSVYVAVPVVLLLFVPLYGRLIARRGHHHVISATLAFFASNAIVFWYGFSYHSAPWLAAAFYIWVNCYAVIAPVQAWAFAASIFDTRQARRLFGLIGGGASLGAIAGGLMARTLVAPLGGAVNLIVLMAGLMAVAAALVSGSRRMMWRRPPAPAPRQHRVPFAEALGFITRTPYLRRVIVLVVLVAIATQWVSFQFSLAAEQRYGGDADRLTSFFGAFNFYLGVVAFLLQLFVTGPVLRRFGMAVTIQLLPAALGLASVLIVLMPELWTVLLAASCDQALRFSTDKSSYQLLYLPITPGMRSNIKATIDMIVSRVADAAGGVLLGVATGGLGPVPGAGFGLRGTAGMNVAFITLWAVVALAVRRGYVLALQDSIRQHRLDLDAERATDLVLNRSTAALIEAKLRAEDPEDVLFALSLFESSPVPLHPAVRFLLDHEQPQIRRKALAVLRAAGDPDTLAKAEQMLADPDLETRTEALLFLAQHTGVDPLQRIEQLGDFPDVSIQAGVIAFLSHPGPTQNLEAAMTMLDAMIEGRGAPATRRRTEAARLLAFLPADFSDQLARLVGDENTAVARQALRAVARRRAWRCAARSFAASVILN